MVAAMSGPHGVVVRYEPRGAARELFGRKDGELLIEGPAGTGKSMACLHKIHLCASKPQYAGMRALIARKTHTSLTASTLVTFRRHVLHPLDGVIFFGGSKERAGAYHYPNGSEIVVGGLDNVEKIMSTDYDMIYVPEATEATLDDWEALTTRLRNGVMPYQQLLADCNPGAPTHWLNQRCNQGQTARLHSRHEDNPLLHDGHTWTPFGLEYIARLDALTGARKERLRYGRWAAAEGAVYEEYDAAIHEVDRFEIPAGWRRLRSVDFGFTNPFSCSWWAIDPDGRMYRYRQLYMTGRLAEDHARQIVTLSRGEHVEATVADHDAEDRATLERHGVPTVAAYKAITPGIQATQARLRKAGDGKPRLYFMRDSLVEVDRSLAARSKPLCTEQEMPAYVWARGVDGKPIKEMPVDLDNHGLDETRYAVAYVDHLAGRKGTYAAGGERTLIQPHQVPVGPRR